MIKSFRDRETQKLFMGRKSGMVSRQAARKAQRLLAQLNEVGSVEEIAIPPGNRLHKLGGTGKASGLSGSRTSTASASASRTGTPTG